MTKKKTKKAASWEKIGKITGKKIEKEFKNKECCTTNNWRMYHGHCHGFVGRLLFAIGVLIALNTLGVLEGISTWVLILIGAGFALMKF